MDNGNRELPAGIAETPPLIPELTLPAPRWRSLSALIAVIIILLVIAGVIIYSHLKYVRLESELDKYESLWNEQEILNYDYTLKIGCFCSSEITSPVIVKVRNGINISTAYASDGRPAINDMFQKTETVEKLFAIIREAIDSKADKMLVEYNQEMGYPVLIAIDQSEMTIDEEIGYTINNFLVIE